MNPEEVIQNLETRIKELEDSNLRTYADFENTKKRLEREKTQSLEYAYEKIAKDLLPVIDALEMALKSVDDSEITDEIKVKFKEGLSFTLENFLKTLERYGITQIPAEGEFNPQLHECILQAPSEQHQEGEIVQTLQKGYQYKERVLRAALVSVCKH
ncbi:nucleotide exchange factor GrpE [Helicobacter monodelphidis]|nr:nucleotide exchange factor GrpE [Helicobacter sp. 15-1451]